MIPADAAAFTRWKVVPVTIGPIDSRARMADANFIELVPPFRA